MTTQVHMYVFVYVWLTFVRGSFGLVPDRSGMQIMELDT